MRANSIVNWFAVIYREGSLRDVQQLAGHASIEMTQRYTECNEAAKRALVQLI
jgi:site-specific recombinase XerD